MDHSELIKSEASKLAEMHFCPEIKAENLASKEANSTLYGAGIGAGLGGLAGGLHGYVKNRGSMKDALKQSLLGALLGGGAGAGLGYAVGQGGKVLDEVAAEVKGSNPKPTSTPGKPAVDPDSFAAQNPNIAALSGDLKTVGSMGAGGAALGLGVGEMAGKRPLLGKEIAKARGHRPITSPRIPFVSNEKLHEKGVLNAKRVIRDVLDNEIDKARFVINKDVVGSDRVIKAMTGPTRDANAKKVLGNIMDLDGHRLNPGAFRDGSSGNKMVNRLSRPHTWSPKARRLTGLAGGGGLGLLGGLGLNYLDSNAPKN